MWHLFRVENIDRWGSNWPLEKCAILTPKLGCLGPKVNFLFWNFVNRAYHWYTWGYNFLIRTTPKNFCFRGMVYFRGSPWFLAISGLCHFSILSTLDFGLWSTKLGGTVRAIKNDPQWQGTRSRPELGGSGRFCVLPKNVFLPKNLFFKKKNEHC